MINARELRLGNLFEYDGRIQICDGVSYKNGGWRIDFKEEAKSKLERVCRPIPITEEWLLGFGFERKTTLYLQILIDDGFIAIARDGSVGFYNSLHAFEIGNSFNRIKKIQYVHQLQNLFYCLTGKELEFNQAKP